MSAPSSAPVAPPDSGEPRPTATALFNVVSRVRPVLAGFEPYDPAFTECRVNLSANENTHELPEGVAEAIAEAAASTALNRYPDPLANGLRDAIASWMGVSRENVLVGNGGDELLFNLLFTFGGGDHELVTCPPDFSEYENFAKMCETRLVPVWRRPDDFSIDEDALVEAARGAAFVILTSPNNPTGNLVDEGLVRRLLDETDAMVLIDEAYVDFADPDASFVPWVATEPRLMVLRTFSKAFALAGLRCGFLVADPAVIDMLAAVRQIYSEDVLAQAIARVAVERRAEFAPVVADIVAERDRVLARLGELAGEGLLTVWPSAANFVLVRMDRAAEVRRRLRDERSILVRDFSAAPGLEGCLRLTVGTRQENDLLLDALEGLLREGA